MQQSKQHINSGARRFLQLIIAAACCFVASCGHPSGLPVCDTGDIKTESVAFWNGSSWEAMGIGLYGIVDAVAVDSVSGTVYCGGTFAVPGTLPGRNLAQWDDANRKWLPVSGGTDGRIFSVLSHNGNVYIGGTFSKCFDTNERWVASGPLAAWNGKSWKTIFGDPCLKIQDMLIHDSSIFLCGRSNCTGQDILYEINLLNSTATVIGATPQIIRCIEIVDDWLYVGGNFSQIEGTGTPLAARWNIRSRQWEGIQGFAPVTGYVIGISSFAHVPNTPHLYVSGNFPLAQSCNDCNDSPAQIDLQSKSVSKLNSVIKGGLYSFIPMGDGGIGVGANASGQSGVFQLTQHPTAWIYLGDVCTSDELNRNTFISKLALYKNGFVVVGKFNYIVLP